MPAGRPGLARALAAVLLTACTDGERHVVAELDLARPEAAARDAGLVDPLRRAHRLGAGWDAPRGDGAWTLGREAEVHLLLPGREHRLELELATLPALAGAGQTVQAALDGEPLGEVRFAEDRLVGVLEAPLPDAREEAGAAGDALPARMRRLTLSARPHAGELGERRGDDARPLGVRLRRLRVTARLGDDERAAWEAALAAPEPPAPVRVPDDARPPRRDPRALPDVLVVLLDAARADRFGCYGYARDTTPRIDALAAEGIVFRRAFSDAAYTIASVPSLLTGRSWSEHGVTRKGDALDRSLPTLAEVLREAGYATLAFSPSPNASRATGADDGFDEFHEVWRADGADPLDPELPERALAARAAEGLGDRPVLCYLHLLPPHEPYTPGPEHDLWSDPGYEGGVDGSREVLKEILHEGRAVDEADRQRLVDLYDGNLHRADASVGRVVDLWRGLERGRGLLVVVLSDHGEAFGEHGRFAHSSTVYDEMVRIPLVVSPAELAPGLERASDALVALSDVLPLLLHALELAPPPGTAWPRRFVDVLADPAAPAPGIALLAGHGVRGWRTRTHLAVADGRYRQELYDVVADPAQREDVRLEAPWRWLELSGALAGALARPPAAAAPRGELTEEDRRVLEALGYL